MTTSIHPSEDAMNVAGLVLPDVPKVERTAKVRKVYRGVLYRTDGKAFPVRPEDGRKFTYGELKTAVGGLIEGIRPTKSGVPYHSGIPTYGVKPGLSASKVCQVWANEEGLLESLPENPYTADVADMAVYKLNGYPDTWRISGDVILIYLVPVNRLNAELEASRMTVAKAKSKSTGELKPDWEQTGILK